MAYLREDYELGFDWKGPRKFVKGAGGFVQDVGGPLGVIIGGIKGLFGGKKKTTTTCVDVCTGQPVGELPKEANCYEMFPGSIGSGALKNPNSPYRGMVEQMRAKCPAGGGGPYATGGALGADVLGMSPMTLLIVVGAILVLRR